MIKLLRGQDREEAGRRTEKDQKSSSFKMPFENLKIFRGRGDVINEELSY